MKRKESIHFQKIFAVTRESQSYSFWDAYIVHFHFSCSHVITQANNLSKCSPSITRCSHLHFVNRHAINFGLISWNSSAGHEIHLNHASLTLHYNWTKSDLNYVLDKIVTLTASSTCSTRIWTPNKHECCDLTIYLYVILLLLRSKELCCV